MAQGGLIQVRIDQTLKNDAEVLFNDLGMDIPSAVRIFFRQALLHNGLPFPVTRPEPFYSRSNMEALGESIRQLESGNVVIKTAEELEVMANE